MALFPVDRVMITDITPEHVDFGEDGDRRRVFKLANDDCYGIVIQRKYGKVHTKYCAFGDEYDATNSSKGDKYRDWMRENWRTFEEQLRSGDKVIFYMNNGYNVEVTKLSRKNAVCYTDSEGEVHSTQLDIKVYTDYDRYLREVGEIHSSKHTTATATGTD